MNLNPSFLWAPASSRQMHPLITFVRSGTAGRTRLTKLGRLETLVNNEPAIVYDQTKRDCRGIQLQPASTNLFVRSTEFNDASWGVKTNASITTGVLDPAGGTNANTFTATAAGAILGQTITGTSGANYVFSVWMRRRTGSGAVDFRVGDNVAIDITSELTSEWKRIYRSAAPTTTTVRGYILMATSGDAVDVYESQMELGQAPSANIHTDGSQVTISEDQPSIVTADLATFLRQGQGTWVFEFTPRTTLVSAAIFRLLQASDTTFRVVLSLTALGTINVVVVNAGVSVGSVTRSGPVARDTTYRVALSYIDGALRMSVNGEAASSSTGVWTVPRTFDSLLIGRNGAANAVFGGDIIAVAYWPAAASAAELPNLSIR